MSNEPNKIAKKMCWGCPYDYCSEASNQAQNWGCLPSLHEIRDHLGPDHSWPCHYSNSLVCAGFMELHPNRKQQPLKPMLGVHADSNMRKYKHNE